MFSRCLALWSSKYTSKTAHGNMTIFQCLKKIFKNYPSEELPKLFKSWLAFNFSNLTNQEIPKSLIDDQIQDLECWNFGLRRKLICGKLELFSKGRSKSLHRFPTQKKFYELCFDLLQSKGAAETVPREMILKSYKDHADIMSQIPDEVDESLIEEFEQFVRPIIRESLKTLKQTNPIPNNHSNTKVSRGEGGNIGYFKEDYKLYHYNDKIRKLITDTRVAPVTITLSGPPNTGKSYRSAEIARQFVTKLYGINCENIDINRIMYTRNCALDHWDGYTNQPVVLLDDMFYSRKAETNVNLEADPALRELLTLVSDADYVLPMADLKDKGKKFTSKLIIISTNVNFRSDYCARGFVEPEAIYRRLGHCTYISHKNQDLFTLYQRKTDPSQFSKKVNEKDYVIGTPAEWINSNPLRLEDIVDIKFKEILSALPLQVYPLDDTVNGDALVVPTAIPHDLNVVKAFAIPEPLKVRMITKPHPYCHVLKRLQLALFNGLKSYRLFKPNYDPNYDLNSIVNSGKLILSGDYSNATDGLNFSISQKAMTVIQEELTLKGETHLSQVVMVEGGKHVVEYPEWTKIEPVVQQNGQLMGSLLSFPILCYVNAFISLKATQRNLETDEVMIHGDDVVMTLDNMNQYHDWVSLAKQVGFGLSIGKCYLSDEFCTFDSRLYVKGHHEASKVSGFKSVSGHHMMKIANLLDAQFPKGMIVSMYKNHLKRSRRSIDRPTVLFGLQKFHKYTRYYETHLPTQQSSRLMEASCLLNLMPRRIRDNKWEIPTGTQHFCTGHNCFEINFDKIIQEMKALKFQLTLEPHTPFHEYLANSAQKRAEELGFSDDRKTKRLAKLLSKSFKDSVNLDILGLRTKAVRVIFHCEGDLYDTFFKLLISKVPRYYGELEPVLIRNDAVVNGP